MDHNDLCEHTKIRLIAAAIGHQQCTKTAANVIPLPGTDRVIAIGTPAEVARLLPAAHLAGQSQATKVQAEPPTAQEVTQQAAKAETAEQARVLAGCDCGCNDPVATDPIEMLEFLAGRFEHAGVSKAVADVYAHDIRKILQALAPTTSTVSAPEEVRAAEQIECWSRDEEDFNARSLGDLLDAHDDLKPGDTVWVGEAVHPDSAQLVNEDGIIENIGEAAYDIGGEHAEDYPEVTREQAKELETLVADWINRVCPPTFYTVENVKPYVLSHEDFPRDLASAQLAELDALRTTSGNGEAA